MLPALAFIANLAGPDLVILFLTFVVLAPLCIASIFALVEILKSNADPLTKLLWVFVVWFIPWIGFVLYFTIGRKTFKTA